MKKIVALIFIVLCVAFSAYSQGPTVQGKTIFKAQIYNSKGVKIHQTLPRKTPVTIVDKTEDFYKILLKDTIACISIADVKIERAKELSFLHELAAFKDGANKKDSQKNTTDSEFKTVENYIDASKLSDAEKSKIEIDHIRFCSLKYRNEIMNGYLFQFMGTVSFAVALLSENDSDDSTKGLLLVAGGAFSLIGTIMIVDSNRWMKRIYLGPNGFGIKYTF